MTWAQSTSPASMLEHHLQHAPDGLQASPEWQAMSGHPTDSSRQLLALLALWRHSQHSVPEEEVVLDGIISAGVLRNLLAALQVRDAETMRHCRRVSIWSCAMGRKLGLDPRELKVLEVAGLVHELGKIGVPDHLLHKPSQLSPDELELFSLYYRIGLDLLQACRVDHRLVEVLSDSRIFFNGINDSFRKVGSQISLGGRILALADAYDSLRSEKPYRTARSHEQTLQILGEKSGTQFDGTLVDCLSRLANEPGLPIYRAAHPQGHPNVLQPQEALAAGALCQILSYLHQLETLYDGFYILDSDLKYVVWNQGLEQLLGRSGSERIGQTWSCHNPEWAGPRGEALTEEQTPLHQVLTTGKSWAGAARIQHSDGTWREIEVQCLPLRDIHGRLHGIAEIFRDTTRIGRRSEDYRDLKLQATVDALTGVANRGELQNQLTKFIELQQEPDEPPLSVIFLDVDHFKSVNDSFGHAIGDKVLILLSKLLQHELYSGEFIGRYGGEEFVVLCPETDLAAAVTRAERLRNAAMKITVPEMKGRMISISLGVSEYVPEDTTATLLHRADQALYTSKQSGRNQTNTLMPNTAEEVAAEEAQAASDPFIYEGELRAVLSAEMVTYKLGGFVREEKAKLQNVTETTAEFRLGNSGFFGGWGQTDDRKPVLVELRFGKVEQTHGRGSSTPRRRVEVVIKPQGRVTDSDLFQGRAHRVFKSLKSYFAADE